MNRTWKRLRTALSPSPRHPRRALMEQLEQRVLLSAEIDVPVVAPLPEALATTANVYPPAASPGEAATATVRHEIVFVDTATPDYQRLVDDLVGQQDDPNRQFEIVLLDGSQDGVARITEVLSTHHDLSAIHLIAHGSDGMLQLGATTLDASYLQRYGDALSAWAAALGGDADILIYGCDVAATSHGRAFVDALSRLTGADVAASTDATGSAALGGDWILEQRAGQVETSVAISAAAQAQWQGLLTTIAYDTGSSFFTGGEGWAGNWSGDFSDFTIAAPLTEPNGLMASTGYSAQLDLGGLIDSTTLTRNLSTTLGTDGTTTWLSFLLQPGVAGLADYMGIEFGGGSGTTQFVGYQGGSFIINDAGGNNTVPVPGISPVSGQTYLMVVRIDHAAGADNVTLYVNPTPGKSAPDSTFSVSKSVNVGSFTRIAIAGGQVLTANDAQLNNIRIGTTYLDVANSLMVTTTLDNNDSGIVDGNASHDIRWLVANPGGDGRISLREAIIAANNTSGTDTITFNIENTSNYTIFLTSALPTIRDAVTIDGSSQFGYLDNGSMPVVSIDGLNGSFSGLQLSATADGSTINGLLLRNFRGNEIVVSTGADNNTISNNFIGALGTNGNYSADSTAGTGFGLYVNGASNLITNNVFAGNHRAIVVDGASATGNRIQGNKIGTNATGTTSIGHFGGGISVQNGASGVIIGTNLDGSNDSAEGNLIANSSAAAISVSSTASNAAQILGNLIYGNSGLGIDLKEDSTSNANDAGDADTGPNGMINYPVIYAAVVSGGNVTITGEARPGAVVEFFIADAAAGAYGEGQTLIGRGTVGASGAAGDSDDSAVFFSFSFTFAAGTMSVGDRVTATATILGATSEFSQNVTSTGSNSAPTISAIANQTIDEDGTTGAIAFTIDDVETALAGLSIVATSGNQTIIPNANITLGGSGANRTITVTPAANQNGGPVTITLQVSDGSNTTQRTFTVTVNPVNDPPVPADDSYTTNEGQSISVPQGTGLLANDSDIEGDTPRVLTVTQPSNGTVTMGSNGSFSYTPNSGFSGTDSFEYLLREEGDGMTHYWGMGGNLSDSVGSSNGTTHGTGTTSGVFGSALAFDGTSSYATLPDVAYNNEFTLSFWFKTPSNAGTGYQYLYAHDAPGTSNSLAVYFIQDATVTGTGAQNVLRTRILDSNDSDNATGLDLNVTTLGLADNNWHQYTLTVRNSVGSTVYIDGVARASISNGGNAINPGGSVMLGALTAGDTSRMFTGALDGLQIFDNALDASAVSALHDSPNRIGTVTIHVNDVPTVTTNTGMSLLQGQTKVITATMLQASDNDNTASELTYTVSNTVNHGRIERSTAPGVAITTFTQADIDAGVIRYVHNNTATPSDSFTFTVSDGDGGTSASTTFSLSISSSNEAPAFTSSAVTTATQGSGYSYLIATSDADAGDTLTITAPTLPAWLTLTDNGDGTATLTGTPNNDAVGTRGVVLQVSDGIATTTQSFTITVANTNDAPTVANAIPNQSATEDSAFLFQFASNTFADVDAGDVLTYSASGLPAWLSFDAATRTFSGTPANADVGTVTVTVRATDGGGAFVDTTFDIVVANTNDAPTFTSSALTTATEDSVYSYAITTSDVDVGDTRTLTATTLPAWLTLTDNGDGTATLTGTPTNAEVGTHSVVLQLSDGNVTVSQAFTVTVSNVNDAPTFTSSALTTAAEDSVYSYAITTSDVDVGDTRTLTATTLPAWLILTDNGDGTATLTGTPTNAEVGTHSVVLQLSDGNATTTQSFTITVSNVNDAPTFTSSALTTAAEDSVYSYAITTSDVDVGDTRTLTATTLPAWLTLTDNGDGTATLTGTPTNAEVGTHSVVLQLSDGNATTTQSFTITVSNVNDAPTFTSSALTTAAEDSVYSYAVTTSDVDVGDTRTLTATTLPAWLTLTDNGDGTATLTGTPTNAEVGTHSVVLQLSDGNTTTTQSFTITVSNVNDAPTFTSSALTTAAEDSVYSYAITTSDVDVGDTRTLTATTLPAWLILTDNGDGTATLTGTPTNAAVGTHSVVLQLSDGNATTTQSFTITVSNVNDAPTFTSSALTTAAEDSVYSYAITTSDVDVGDTRTLTATTLPAWLTLTDNGDGTATLTGTPTNAEVGTHSVVLQLSDGNATTTQSFTITVTNVNDAPTLSAFSNQTINEDGSTSALAFTIADIDSAIGSLNVTATSSDAARIPNAGLVIGGSGANRTLTVTPAANANGGPVTITVTVSDGGLSNATTFLVTITPVNDTPVLQHAEVVRVTQDGRTVVDATTLQVTDIDNGATSLQFTITRLPVEGDLLRNGVALGIGDNFTQADINSGRVTYSHRGGTTNGVDIVELSVSDGAGGTLPVVSLLMDIEAASAPPPTGTANGGGSDTGTPTQNNDSSRDNANEVDAPTSDAAPEAVANGERADTPAVAPSGPTGTDSERANSTEGDALNRRFSGDADRGSRRGTGGAGGVARLPTGGTIIQQDLAPPPVHATTADTGSGSNVYRAALSAMSFRNGLDEVREQFSERTGEQRTVVASSIAMSTGVSIGYVIWLLRGGVLIGSVLSSLPAWRLLDPTPVLSGALAARATNKDDEDESLEEMLRRAAERADRQDARPDTTPDQQSGPASADNGGSPENAR